MILIIGRSGSGKDFLARELAKQGLSQVKSYTTRPPRYEGENTHIFLSAKEARGFGDKIATTVINGYEYFATSSQMKNNDVYIIDPRGTAELLQNCPEVTFDICYLQADDSCRRAMAVGRGSDLAKEAKVYDMRNADEDAQFREFENMLKDTYAFYAFKNKYPNVRQVIIGHNDYRPETMNNLVQSLTAPVCTGRGT